METKLTVHSEGHECPTCTARKAVFDLFDSMLNEGESPASWITGAIQAVGNIAGFYTIDHALMQKMFRDSLADGGDSARAAAGGKAVN